MAARCHRGTWAHIQSTRNRTNRKKHPIMETEANIAWWHECVRWWSRAQMKKGEVEDHTDRERETLTTVSETRHERSASPCDKLSASRTPPKRSSVVSSSPAVEISDATRPFNSSICSALVRPSLNNNVKEKRTWKRSSDEHDVEDACSLHPPPLLSLHWHQANLLRTVFMDLSVCLRSVSCAGARIWSWSWPAFASNCRFSSYWRSKVYRTIDKQSDIHSEKES